MNGDDFGSDAGSEQAFERALLASAAGDGVGDESVRAAWSRFALTLGATATLAGAATHGALASGVTTGVRGVVRWISLGALGGGIVTAALISAFGGRGVPATGGAGAGAAAASATAGGVASSNVRNVLAPTTATGAVPSAPRPAGAEGPVGERALAGEPRGATPAPKRHDPRSAREAKARDLSARADAASSSLAAEIALLDEARRAQSSGQFEHALAVLARYQREHPDGELRRESDVLKLETLSRRGDREEAARLARHFLEAFPDDPHATHVRTFVQ